jgi:hypothetical protein
MTHFLNVPRLMNEMNHYTNSESVSQLFSSLQMILLVFFLHIPLIFKFHPRPEEINNKNDEPKFTYGLKP